MTKEQIMEYILETPQNTNPAVLLSLLNNIEGNKDENDSFMKLIDRSIITVNIPNNITSIGKYTFSYCDLLTDVNIPDSVVSIKDGAFYECTSLINVNIPNSVTTIESLAFAGCTSLISIDIPDSVMLVGSQIFFRCSSLVNVRLSNNIEIIGSSMFQKCTSLTNIDIPDSVNTIGSSAFYGCTSLMNITCRATTPPQITNGVFKNVPDSCLIYVPRSSVQTYKTASNWSTRATYIKALSE